MLHEVPVNMLRLNEAYRRNIVLRSALVNGVKVTSTL